MRLCPEIKSIVAKMFARTASATPVNGFFPASRGHVIIIVNDLTLFQGRIQFVMRAADVDDGASSDDDVDTLYINFNHHLVMTLQLRQSTPVKMDILTPN